ATRDIYYNANFTDGENVFVKVTRYTDDSYWFNREVREAAIAHELLEGIVPTPRPLILSPLVLSNGMLASVWEHVPTGSEPETARTKTRKLLRVAKTLADLTPERLAHKGQDISPAGWVHSLEKARNRLKLHHSEELEANIVNAVDY